MQSEHTHTQKEVLTDIRLWEDRNFKNYIMINVMNTDNVKKPSCCYKCYVVSLSWFNCKINVKMTRQASETSTNIASGEMQIYAKWSCTQWFDPVNTVKNLRRNEQSSHKPKPYMWNYLAICSWIPWRWLVLELFQFLPCVFIVETYAFFFISIQQKNILCLCEDCLGWINILYFQIYTISLEKLFPVSILLLLSSE